MRAEIKIYNEDCLDMMRKLEDSSINLVCIDPPYNIGVDEWDKIDNYIEWMGSVFLEIQRVLKDNGSFYWFHNDMPQISKLMEWLDSNSDFKFNGMIHWIKPNFRPVSWRNPSELSNLRSWFNCVECCLFYTFQDNTGLDKILEENVKPKHPFAKYLREEFKRAEANNRDIAKLFPSKTGGLTGCVNNWLNGDNIMTREQYEIVRGHLGIGFLDREYESLRQEYESLRQEYESLRYTHNLDKNHNNIWTCKEVNSGKYHLTQKPLLLIERIIKTSSNAGDTVLDCFMGSGTAGIASFNLKRKFIGSDKDKKNFDIAKKRLENHKSQEQLF